MQKNVKKIFLMALSQCALLLILCVNMNAAYAIKGIEKITEVEGITEYRLKNGLQVLLVPDQTKDSITVNVTYRVGSKHENYGETGMAHLLEHLLFKGTPRHPNIPDELSERGAKPNGTTSSDRTNYYETFAATEDNLKWALAMEADRMVNSFVRQEDLDSEMTVVRNELERGENNPFQMTWQKMRAASYMWHNYGKSTIGAVSDLENVSIEKLKAFYKTYYQPDNATLIVAGKFDTNKTLKLIKKTFGKISKPKRKLPILYTQEPAGDGEREVTVRRTGDVQLTLFGFNTPAAAHQDNAALYILSFILGDTPTGRLHKALVEKKIATQVFSWTDTNADSSQILLGAIVSKDAYLKKAEEVIQEQISLILDTPITEKEFERAKRAYLNGFEKSAGNTENVAIKLSDWVSFGDWRLRFLRRDQIEKTKIEDIHRVANHYLRLNNRIIGRFIPTQKPDRIVIPQAPNLGTLLEGYKGNQDISLGEAFDPSYENIHNQTRTVNITDTIKARYLAKKTRGEKVNIELAFRFGDADSLANTGRFSDVFSSMLTKGTTTKTREEITDAFDKINTQISVNHYSGLLSVKIDTQKEHVTQAIQLVSELVKNATFPEKELELIKASRKTNLEYVLQDPNNLAKTAAQKRLMPLKPSHPAYPASTQEELDYLDTYTAKDLIDYHKQFISADNMLVSAVGDFDETTFLAEIKNNLGNWVKGVQFKEITLPYKKIDTSPITFNTPGKENGIFLAVDLFNINNDHEDYPALKLGNTVLGGGFINSRLATRMRQKEGWSYGAGSSITGSTISPRTRFTAYAIGAPQNLLKIEAAYKEEIAKLLKDGFSNEEIEKAKTGIKQRSKLSRSNDAKLVGSLLNGLRFNKTMLDIKEKEDKLLALSEQDVLNTMKKYFSEDDVLFIKARDEKKALAK